jgi:hypothetical protein
MGVYCAGFGKLNKSEFRRLSGSGFDEILTAARRKLIAPVGFDLGFTGSGIWSQAPLVKCEQNEMYGSFDAGIAVDTARMIGTDHNGNAIGIVASELPAGLESLIELEDGKARTHDVPYKVINNRSYGCSIGLESYGNNPPDGFWGTFRGGGHYNILVGVSHWPAARNQLVDDIEFINDATLSAGKSINEFYGNTAQFTFRDVRARDFLTGINLPPTGANVVEGTKTKLECQYNIDITANNAPETTTIRLADSNFGLPTHDQKAFSRSLHLNIRLEKDTNPSFIRNIEWHRPGLPALRLWSNPEFAPDGAFEVPEVSGVATEIQ